MWLNFEDFLFYSFIISHEFNFNYTRGVMFCVGAKIGVVLLLAFISFGFQFDFYP